MKDSGEIIKEASTRVKKLWGYKDNPEDLSACIHELAVLNFGLGTWLAEFEDAERVAKTDVDLEHAEIVEKYINQDMPVSRAEVKAKIDLGDKRRDYNQIVKSVQMVKICRHDIETVIDTGRSRLSLIKQDMQRAE